MAPICGGVGVWTEAARTTRFRVRIPVSPTRLYNEYLRRVMHSPGLHFLPLRAAFAPTGAFVVRRISFPFDFSLSPIPFLFPIS